MLAGDSGCVPVCTCFPSFPADSRLLAPSPTTTRTTQTRNSLSITAKHQTENSLFIAAGNHYDVRFLLEAMGEELVKSDEVLGVRWVPLGEVAAIVTDRSVLRAATKLPHATSSG